MKKTILLYSCLLSIPLAFGQTETTDSTATSGETLETTDYVEAEEPIETFVSTRIINGHSVETLSKGKFEFRIEHRFGDFAGSNGGVQNWFGFDNASDIRFAFEYGITDKLMVGLGRSKGTGNPYRSLVDGFLKYRVLHQQAHGMPVSLSVLGTSSITYMKATEDISQVSHFPKFEHRLAYSAQVNVARKFGKRISLAVMPSFVYRNYVPADDVNALFAVGGAIRYAFKPTMAFIVEYYQTIHEAGVRKTNTNSLGVAVEWNTFGHNFTINLTNSKGFGETQFIPYTYEDWLKGQFRLGFTISRAFYKKEKV
jgi:hypothetical protein